jgi:hypothetical protein
MSVPSTILSAREQIREAIKLSFSSHGYTAVESWIPTTNYALSSYPLVRAMYNGTTTTTSLFMGSESIEQEAMKIQVCPNNTQETAEYETSKVIESAKAYFNPDVVRTFMDIAYQNSLVDITLETILTSNTMTTNPYCFTDFNVIVKYRATN